MTRKLILSSSSKARLNLLSRLQIPFEAISPGVDETPLDDESIENMVVRLAELKAKKAAQNYPDAYIIGCDQVGVVDNTILNKPLVYERAAQQLELVSGKKITFYTALCLLDAKTRQLQTAIETYHVYFRKLTLEEITHYLHKEKPFHCAGSFQAEGLGIALIEKFEGNDYTALIGLPLICLTEFLKKAGWDILNQS